MPLLATAREEAETAARKVTELNQTAGTRARTIATTANSNILELRESSANNAKSISESATRVDESVKNA